jgi:hypothetical protein
MTLTAQQIADANAFAARCAEPKAPKGGEALRGIPQIAMGLGLVRMVKTYSPTGDSVLKYQAAA